MVRLRAVMVTKNAGGQGEKQENRKTRHVLYCGTKQLNCFSNQGIYFACILFHI